MTVNSGNKQTEIGLIPEDWQTANLGSLVEASAPIRYGIVQIGPDTSNGVPIVPIKYLKDIKRGSLHRASRSIEQRYAGSRVRHNDILLSVKGTIGQVGLVPEGFAGNIAREIARIRIKNGLIPQFIAYYLKGSHTQEQIHRAVVGTTRQEFSIAAVRNFEIALPPAPEQRAIAKALGDVDALLDALDRLIAKKRDLKQAAMQQLLTGQIRLPGFAGEWELKRLGEVGKCLRGVSYKGDSDLSTHDTPHTKRLLRSNNVQSAIVVTDEVQFVDAARVASHQILQGNDILICMANGSKALVGKAGLFMVDDGYEYTFGAFMGCFRTICSEANPAFVFYLFLTARYRGYINNLLAGSSINNLRPSSIESLVFSTPPLLEQTAIATVLSDLDAEIDALEQRRAKTAALKQGMMQELLTGRTRLV